MPGPVFKTGEGIPQVHCRKGGYENRSSAGTARALRASNDAELREVADAWEELPEPVRARILAMVRAANRHVV